MKERKLRIAEFIESLPDANLEDSMLFIQGEGSKDPVINSSTCHNASAGCADSINTRECTNYGTSCGGSKNDGICISKDLIIAPSINNPCIDPGT